MRKLANHTALKEWSNIIDSLGRGAQMILIRKGGLADPDFGLESREFYLYPTFFHQGESDARPSVEITHWAEAVRTWSVRELDILRRLEEFVDIPRDTLEARYRFRPDQALHVVAVRVWRLPAPAVVQFREEYAGCRSWISIEEEVDVDGSAPVLPAEELGRRIDEVESVLVVPV